MKAPASRTYAILLLVTTLVGIAGCSVPTPPVIPTAPTASVVTPSTRSAPAEVHAIRIVVIGDSLSDGNDTPGYPWTTPAQRLLTGVGLPAQIVNSSAGGAGYVQPGDGGATFESLAAAAVTAETGIVVIFGSDNDTADPALSPAVTATIEGIQQTAPTADILVVGAPSTDSNGDDVGDINTIIRRAAETTDATFTDATRWLTEKPNLLADDGEHPNIEGENHLAARFKALLEPVIRVRLGREGPARP